MKIFLVGGAVRDKHLGLAIKDRDWVVVGSNPEEMLQLGYQPVGQDFPVFLHPETHEEYALARTERKSGKGYTGFTFFADSHVSIEQDLSRRDLTINAMAESSEGELLDPFEGLKDLHNCLLRHVSPAFQEDPLRILRTARFLARFHHLGFKIADETMTLMQSMVNAGEVEYLVKERIWSETERALQEQNPQCFFNTLTQCGALSVIMPTLDQCLTSPANINNLMNDPLQALSCAVQRSKNTAIRWAALTHQIPLAENSSYTGLVSLCDSLKLPRYYKELTLTCAKHRHRYADILNQSPEAILDLLNDLDYSRRPERLEDFLVTCETSMPNLSVSNLESLPQTQFIQAVAETARAVTAKKFIDLGFKGCDIKKEMESMRLQQISHMLDSWELTSSQAY